MITVAICVVAVIWIAGLVIFIIGTRRAPFGEEDEDGFRVVPRTLGKPPVASAEPPQPPVTGAKTKKPGAGGEGTTPSC